MRHSQSFLWAQHNMHVLVQIKTEINRRWWGWFNLLQNGCSQKCSTFAIWREFGWKMWCCLKAIADFICHFQNRLNVPHTVGTKQHTGHAFQREHTKEKKQQKRENQKLIHYKPTSLLPKSEILKGSIIIKATAFSQSYIYLQNYFKCLAFKSQQNGVENLTLWEARQAWHITRVLTVGMLLPRVWQHFYRKNKSSRDSHCRAVRRCKLLQ